MSYYSQDMVRTINAEIEDDTLVVSVVPRLESAFYLAGVEKTQANDRIELKLVRCRISTECNVDIPAEITPGAGNPYRIVLGDTSKPVDIIYDDGSKSQIYAC